MEKMIPTCELVLFSGSSPCKETDKIFPEGIRIANKYDKVSICDTYGNHLKDCLNASPTIIHNNIDEIKASLDVKLKSEKENLRMLDSFYKKGIKQSFITNAEKPFYASNFDFHYKVSLPKIDTVDSTGSGDAFTAGVIYGWHNKMKFEDQLRFASALGVHNARSFEVCDIDIENALQMIEQIKVNPIGKKIKEINDMPG
jgi:fructose-1-phosphate kinase PfkB-like protein